MSGFSGAYLAAGKPDLRDRIGPFGKIHSVLSGIAVVAWLLEGRARRDASDFMSRLEQSRSLQLVVGQCAGIPAGFLVMGILWLIGRALSATITTFGYRRGNTNMTCLLLLCIVDQ